MAWPNALVTQRVDRGRCLSSTGSATTLVVMQTAIAKGNGYLKSAHATT
jgi:hypothetical protein